MMNIVQSSAYLGDATYLKIVFVPIFVCLFFNSNWGFLFYLYIYSLSTLKLLKWFALIKCLPSQVTVALTLTLLKLYILSYLFLVYTCLFTFLYYIHMQTHMHKVPMFENYLPCESNGTWIVCGNFCWVLQCRHIATKTQVVEEFQCLL